MTGLSKSQLLAIFFGVIIGIMITFDIVTAYSLPDEYTNIEAGTMLDNNHQLFTYETLCKGYYIKDTSNKNKIKYIGFGDLDFKYTYEEDIPTIISTATTSKP
jgi:hypothetical protein